MASVSETPKKANKNSENMLKKIGRFFKRAAVGLVNSFRNMYAELKKVTWPTPLELRNYSLVVLAFMLFMGVVIGLIDSVSAIISNWIIGA